MTFLDLLFSGGRVSAFPTWTMSLSTDHPFIYRLHLWNMAALEVDGVFSSLHVSLFQVLAVHLGPSTCFLWLFVSLYMLELENAHEITVHCILYYFSHINEKMLFVTQDLLCSRSAKMTTPLLTCYRLLRPPFSFSSILSGG